MTTCLIKILLLEKKGLCKDNVDVRKEIIAFKVEEYFDANTGLMG